MSHRWYHSTEWVGRRGASDGRLPFETAMVVSYRLSLHCDQCANHSATICHWMSATL